jgi:CheY-like chemotaxis protein
MAEAGDYILVVDDTNFMRLLLGKILGSFGHRVVSVPLGEDALRTAEAAPPKLVFLDLDLPGDDGDEVCAHLRKVSGCDKVPIIICTAHSTREGVERCARAGANDFLCKPVDRYNVGERLIKHLGPEAAPAS